MTTMYPKVRQGRPPIYRKPMVKLIRLRVPEPLAAALEAEAERAGVSIAQVLRWAAEEYLSQVRVKS